MEAWIKLLLAALVQSLGELDPSDGWYDEIMATVYALGIDIEAAGEITEEARLKMQRIRVLGELARLDKAGA